MLSRVFSVALIFFVFTLDRLLKIWISIGLKIGESFPVWPGVFHLTLVNNTGAAFGLWQDSRVLLTLFSIVSVFWIICYLLCRPGRTHAFAWSLIAGGALGNLVDRLAYGYVIDYLDFHIWPVFNLADACICVGVAWIVIRFMVHPPKPSSKTHASDPL